MGAPLFILSFRHRDEVSRLAESAGWAPIAARRAENAEARFVASGASVAVVDARGALAEGEEAVRAIGDAAEANAAALLVLLSRGDGSALERFLAHGATHFLVARSPSRNSFTRCNSRSATPSGRGATCEPPPGGRGGGFCLLALAAGLAHGRAFPALARQAGLGEEAGRRISLMDLFRKLDPEGRRAAREAIDRLLATGEATAFAHGERWARIAHHVRRQEGGDVVGRAEPIRGEGEGRDPLTGLRDGRAARAWLGERLGEGVVALLVSVSRYDAINAAFGGRPATRASGGGAADRAAGGGRGTRALAGTDGGSRVRVLLPAPAAWTRAASRGQLVEAIGGPSRRGPCHHARRARRGRAKRGGDDPAALLRRASRARRGEGGEGSPFTFLRTGPKRRRAPRPARDRPSPGARPTRSRSASSRRSR